MPIDRLELDKGVFTHRREGDTEMVFEHRGSIPHGPDFYALWFRTKDDPPNGRFAGPGWKVLFGELAKSSKGGRYCVVEEWHDLGSPNTAAFIVDVTTKRGAVLSHVGRGFVRGITFEPDDGSSAIARVRLSIDLYDGESKWHSEAREVPLADVSWQPLKWWP